MNPGGSVQAGAWAQVRVREPGGERVLGERLTVGAAGCDIVVPGVDSGAALIVRRRPGVWLAEAAPGAAVSFNGTALTAERDLRRNDVLSVGDAQLKVTDASRTLLRLTVDHLAGNVTIAPAAALVTMAPAESADQDLEIEPAALVVPAPAVPSGAPVAPVRRGAWLVAVLATGIAALLATQFGSVDLELNPPDARVHTPGALSVRFGRELLVFAGRRVVRAERDGYRPAEAALLVRARAAHAVRLTLARLPGRLEIDTGGVVATVSIDGVAAGLAPGLLSVPAGERTVSVRAPRYLDYTTTLTVEGAGVRQDLHVQLQPAWGRLTVSAVPQGAHVSIDGAERGTAPLGVEASSGVHRIRIEAPGWKSWESSVVLKGGQALAVGPVTLGQPDAHLTVSSTPAGAEVTVAGTLRGRTPLAIELPAGIAYPVIVALPGYATWSQDVFASAGRALSADARLAAVFARVTVRGEPADAELLVDGVPRGSTPQSLNLPALEHRVEVRKAGYLSFEALVAPAPGLERTVEYHLTPADRGRALLESAPLIRSQIGYVLRLVPPGTFQMGSERRDQGRRPNESSRSVTLRRPYYLGVQPVTNGEFRRFRAGHVSGFIERQSIDLDDQPVTQVSWDEAAEFCNWLSQLDGLPPAYEKSGDALTLIRPVTRGYRLPTEAEWEYAARYGPAGESRRFVWGDAPPVPAQVGNLAGSETGSSLPATLPGYRDDYPALAPIGRFRTTALGLHDMSGNVSQWMNDYYQSFVDASPATDPLGPAEGRLHAVRGANWKTSSVTELRLAWRDTAEGPAPTLGFRLARYAEDRTE